MRSVTKRAEIELVPELLAHGTADELDLEAFDRLFGEGDLGQLDLLLDPSLPDDKFRDAHLAMEELEADLLIMGVLPWPGAPRIAELDWPGRVVTFRFQQGLPFFVAVASAVASWLIRVGVRFGPGLFRSILNFFKGLPLLVNLIGGAALFLLLAPEGTAWRVFRWVGRAVGKGVEEATKGVAALFVGLAEGLGPLLLIGAGGLAVAGVLKLQEARRRG